MAGGLQHDAILSPETSRVADKPGTILGVVDAIANILFRISAVALLAAGFVLTGGVIYSHLTGIGLEWQDEVTIFLVAGAMFLSAAYVQGKRGHVGIELLPSYLSKRGEAVRSLLVDMVALVFVAIFAWETAALLREAIHEGQTSHSAWGPPVAGVSRSACSMRWMMWSMNTQAMRVTSNAWVSLICSRLQPQRRPRLSTRAGARTMRRQ